MAGRSSSCSASNPSLLICTTLRRFVHLQLVSVNAAKAWQKAWSAWWERGIQKMLPAILILSVTISKNYRSLKLFLCRLLTHLTLSLFLADGTITPGGDALCFRGNVGTAAAYVHRPGQADGDCRRFGGECFLVLVLDALCSRQSKFF